jgi:caa(3)-type oxidase subunit IV
MSESTSSPAAASAAAHGHDHGHDDVASHLKMYWVIGGTLFVCTVLTVVAAYHIDLHSRAANLALGIAIATFKSSLVALIFMHLKHERNLIYKVLLFTAFFAFAMMFLILFTHSDPIPGTTGSTRGGH